ncbi:nucleotidyltransferase family protein [Paenibacillus sp. S150]|uniref:nucleotidyltransferase family protein n=1 Tax=Paenibacillus sp. S150 TaxID=2749826 RepID=UPI001C580D2B|nr:nucleotidyltransferase family protein [Paenibacillus sp. S150]MBW4081654.1 CBS domain-containing protein [Paenibacillus sp. S150]
MKNVQHLLLSPESKIIEALEAIDRGAVQIVLIVDRNNRLLGTVTDGDIRRGILSGIKLEQEVRLVMNSHPYTASQDESRETILTKMKISSLRQIPVINDEGIIVGLELFNELLENRKRDNWIILMAGGLGTRLGELTKDTPKPLLKVGSKPILEVIMENFISSGFYRFYISVNYRADMIMDYFGDGAKWGVEIRYINENKRMGTAGALSLMSELPDQPFFVMNGDLLTKINFQHALQFHLENDSMATMCVREYEYQVPYGVVKVDRNQLCSIEEKPIYRYFVSGGIYILNPDVLSYVPKDTFYDMPTLFDAIMADKQTTCAFPIHEYWLDIGRIDDFNKANGEYPEVFKLP